MVFLWLFPALESSQAAMNDMLLKTRKEPMSCCQQPTMICDSLFLCLMMWTNSTFSCGGLSKIGSGESYYILFWSRSWGEHYLVMLHWLFGNTCRSWHQTPWLFLATPAQFASWILTTSALTSHISMHTIQSPYDYGPSYQFPPSIDRY